jgi:hypothetical protein
VVEPESVLPLKEALGSYCDACDRDMKMIQWGVEEVV